MGRCPALAAVADARAQGLMPPEGDLADGAPPPPASNPTAASWREREVRAAWRGAQRGTTEDVAAAEDDESWPGDEVGQPELAMLEAYNLQRYTMSSGQHMS